MSSCVCDTCDYVSDLVSLTPCFIKHIHQGPSGIKVPRLDMCGSMISLSEIVHQMWHDHPFSQRNKTTERAMGVGVGDDRERGGLDKFEKGGVGSIGGRGES